MMERTTAFLRAHAWIITGLSPDKSTNPQWHGKRLSFVIRISPWTIIFSGLRINPASSKCWMNCIPVVRRLYPNASYSIRPRSFPTRITKPQQSRPDLFRPWCRKGTPKYLDASSTMSCLLSIWVCKNRVTTWKVRFPPHILNVSIGEVR